MGQHASRSAVRVKKRLLGRHTVCVWKLCLSGNLPRIVYGLWDGGVAAERTQLNEAVFLRPAG
jgi:hypothetical protein